MMLGTYKREFPRGYVMRGWDPQNPSKQTTALPVATDAYGRPDQIFAGMIISSADGNTWTHKTAHETSPGMPTILNTLSVAQDGIERWDVMAADSLVGLSCTGEFRFATPFFARYKKGKSTTTTPSSAHLAVYTKGTPLTYCKATETEYAYTEVDTTTGALMTQPNGSPRSLAGFIRPAEEGEAVIGVVAETHSGRNRAARYGTTDAVSARADQESIGKAVESTAKFTNAYMVIWDSQLVPQAPTA